ncbi:hypothetical protein Tco_0253138 [Tanacetum coccineum]
MFSNMIQSYLNQTWHDKMAEENVHAPTRTDEQLVPNTNFFSAFTASADVPSIYIQQFWNTLTMDTKSGIYSFQLDELWFTLVASLLRNALGITPKDSTHPFVAPYVGDLTWRTILSMINQCITGKTSGSDRPRHPVLQILWGVVTGTNIDYVKLIWEEFVQAIKTFFYDATNLKVPTKKPKPHVIPYCRFTKLIICYLGGRHNIHKRPQSPLHITADDYSLRNLKFVPKGELDEVFEMPIPKDLIIDVIRNLKYYQKYLEMVARKPRQVTTVTDEEGGKKKKASPAGMAILLTKKMKNLNRLLNLKWKMMSTIYKELKKKSTTDQYIFQRRTPVTQDASTGPSTQPQDDTSANVVCDTPSHADAETGADTEKSNSVADTEILNVGEKQGGDVSNTVALEQRTVELDEGQTRLDPGKTPESRHPPEHVLMEEDQAGSNPRQSHVVQAGPNVEPIHKDFIAIVYPQVHESVKHTTKEHIHIENPPSSSGTLSSMKNLDDAFTFGDQFLNDKRSEEEPGKANMETEVESMVTIPIYQASSPVPALSTPIIDLTPPKPVSPLVQAPTVTATTATTTTTLPLPPPPP